MRLPEPSLTAMGFPMSAEEFSRRRPMHGIIYLIGLIVVIMFLLSLLGLR